ncbi:MAG: gamma-glutamyl-gamma-aminobutyrate hydrolase family protein [Solirubrobacterales bacterium]
MRSGQEPVIGICAVAERARWSFWDQRAHLVSDSYVGTVQRGGGIALLLPVAPPGAVPALLARVDGVMLIGGADVDPKTYGAEPHPATEATYVERDEFEVEVVRLARQRRLPLLGICRGMQLLNVALGGTLVQDLLAQPENPHRRRLGSFDGTGQTVRLEPGSRAALAAEEHEHVGCCHHHQAIDRVGEGLLTTGVAEDGVPEAIETGPDWWALGVQWHPEADPDSHVIASFILAARGPGG